jgi:hypothetical protein
VKLADGQSIKAFAKGAKTRKDSHKNDQQFMNHQYGGLKISQKRLAHMEVGTQCPLSVIIAGA